MKIHKRATIRDIAKLAQTSVATVSWVLNGNSRKFVSDELRNRVKQAAQELNYHPNLLAQRLKGKSRKLLAIIVPQFENVFFNHLVIGAEKYANQRGYKLLICSSEDNSHKEIELVNQIISSWVDGFLIAPTTNGEKAVDLIIHSGIPMVLLDRTMDRDVDYVGMNNFQNAYEGTKYLIDHGHRRIAYIGWDTDLGIVIDRNEGFLKAIDEAGISRSEILFRRCDRDAESGYYLAKEILMNHPMTALFIDQNNIAEGVVRATRETKKRIPEDISILIYGDPSWAALNVPEFTCISLPDLLIGAEGAKHLINRLEGLSDQRQKQIFPGRLIERGSVCSVNHNVSMAVS